MVFTNAANNYKGFGLLTITSDDPTSFESVSKKDWLDLVSPGDVTEDNTPTFEWKFDPGYEDVEEVNLFVSSFSQGS
ncbi:MAG: hypothetical protein KI793_30585 [Rivularia sp. (in: Bacteria)]|nr:hypothetical protein [Rivularia sp. MS3]